MIADALLPLEGDWTWQFLEGAGETHQLSIRDGQVTEAGLPCTVAVEGNEIRIRLNDGTSELRFDSSKESGGAIPATFWALPDGLDDIDRGDAMELLEDAELLRA